MSLQKRTVDGYECRCRNQSKDNRHDVVRSVRKGTWFSESKLAITIILRLTRYWFVKPPPFAKIVLDLLEPCTKKEPKAQLIGRAWTQLSALRDLV
ncbi:hypothetical protein TNCV_3606281 [Trichonephila clavipes]|nr:hypothetical protein TNCV_3606281 [Trichonephila clavipes]